MKICSCCGPWPTDYCQIPDAGARVNNGNRLRVGNGKAHTRGVAAKFLKASLTNGR